MIQAENAGRQTALAISQKRLTRGPAIQSARTLRGVLSACLILGILSPPAWGADGSLPATVADGAMLTPILADGRFYEGPTWDRESKKLYFTAWHENKSQILRLDAPQKASVYAGPAGAPDGMFLANDGRLLAAEVHGHRIVSYSLGPDGPIDEKVLVSNPRFNQPNDVAQAPNGDIYFTDPGQAQNRPSVVYVSTTDVPYRPIIFDCLAPNGVIVSNDGKTLYVSDDIDNNWRAYGIQPDGSVGPGRLFFDPPVPVDKRIYPDGMTIDEKGTLYLTGNGGVWVVDKFGASLGLIPIKEFASNCTFGGDDGKTLFITCDKRVYSLAMKVRGGEFVRTNKVRETLAAAIAKRDQIDFRENVEYGTGGAEKLTLHLARPRGAKARPGLLFFHGGGFYQGSKDAHRNEIVEAARRGCVAVSVGYRLVPKYLFPAPIEDAKCAVRWMRAHADELGVDPERLGAIGYSAGAMLAMYLGTMDKDDGLEGTGGWAEQSSKVQAVVAYFGPTDLTAEFPEFSRRILENFIGGPRDQKLNEYRRASPITYVSPGDAPTLFFMGTSDILVPNEHAVLMARALTEAKVPGRVELLLGANHGWAGRELERTTQGAYDFFQRYLGR
ncbi:MAG: SMP-30/gluconolactonase/LRE family protein [Planctomycetaceae bacterium]